MPCFRVCFDLLALLCLLSFLRRLALICMPCLACLARVLTCFMPRLYTQTHAHLRRCGSSISSCGRLPRAAPLWPRPSGGGRRRPSAPPSSARRCAAAYAPTRRAASRWRRRARSWRRWSAIASARRHAPPKEGRGRAVTATATAGLAREPSAHSQRGAAPSRHGAAGREGSRMLGRGVGAQCTAAPAETPPLPAETPPCAGWGARSRRVAGRA